MDNSFSKLGLGTSTIASFGRSLAYIRAKKLNRNYEASVPSSNI